MIRCANTQLIILFTRSTDISVIPILRSASANIRYTFLCKITMVTHFLFNKYICRMLKRRSISFQTRTKMQRTAHKGRCNSNVVHQYCICNVNICGGGIRLLSIVIKLPIASYRISNRTCSGRSKYHLSSNPSR